MKILYISLLIFAFVSTSYSGTCFDIFGTEVQKHRFTAFYELNLREIKTVVPGYEFKVGDELEIQLGHGKVIVTLRSSALEAYKVFELNMQSQVVLHPRENVNLVLMPEIIQVIAVDPFRKDYYFSFEFDENMDDLEIRKLPDDIVWFEVTRTP